MAEGGAPAVPAVREPHGPLRSLSQDDALVERNLVVDHGKLLVRGLTKIREHTSFCDVVLVVGDKKIKAHKVVLFAFSPYFEALLSLGMRESKQNEIEIHDINFEILEKLIDFAYTGIISYTGEDVQELLRVANFLDIHLVQQECAQYIVKHLDSQNCAGIYTLGKQIGEEIMYAAAMQYLLENFVMFSKSIEFLELPFAMFEDALRSEDIRYTDPEKVPIPSNQEEALVKAVIAYVEHDRENRMALLPKLMELVRLPVMIRSTLTSYKEHPLLQLNAEAQGLLNKALDEGPEFDPKADCNLWRKHRNNGLLSSYHSQSYANGGQVRPVVERYDDSTEVPITAHVIGMKIWIRTWDGRPVWGGYETRYSNGKTIMHGEKEFGPKFYKFEEFSLQHGEVIISVQLNSGWMIDQLTFTTNMNRVLGPYGGPGGGQRSCSHGGKTTLAGYLVCTKGAVALTQDYPGIIGLSFIWANNNMKKSGRLQHSPSHLLPVNVRDFDYYSGEEDYDQIFMDDESEDLDEMNENFFVDSDDDDEAVVLPPV